MLRKLLFWWEHRPLACILISGLFFRLIAAFFSKGFGMIDDHFLIIEQAQSWVDGVNINNWLPQLSKNAAPPGFSYFYTGLHYLLFSLLEKTGIYDPQVKMYIVRLLHAGYSMLTVYFGYRITEKLTNVRYAKQVGLLLALFWFWPFLSVRNLVEVVCIPMLMWATWLVVKDDSGNRLYFLAGIMLGFAFNIRYQTLFFSFGFLLAVLLKKGLIKSIVAGAGLLVCAMVFQGGIDWFIWHAPFVEFRGYIAYNLKYATSFILLPWYSYLLLFSGILIPPVSLFLLIGFFMGYKKYILLFLPSFIFLLFHSWFPNKQERFILPILPFVIILGTIGWSELMERKGLDVKYRRSLIYSQRFFYVLNTALLILVSFTYSKRNRVEAMHFLAGKADLKNLVVENSNNDDDIGSPRFYLHKWPDEYTINKRTNIADLCPRLKSLPDSARPNYVIFYDGCNIQQRVAKLQQFFNLEYETTVYPSFMDVFMHQINPVNENAVTYIYRIN